MQHIKQKCKDDLDRGACLAYGLEVFNFEEKSEIEGIIDFHLNGLENLSYMVLDENDNVYLDITHINKDNPTNLSFRKSIYISKGSRWNNTF